MTTDTTRNARVLREDRKTLMQLLDAAEKDTDAVSVFMAGTTVADTEAAVFVVKGPEHIAYLRAMCERQGMLTADKPVAAPLMAQAVVVVVPRVPVIVRPAPVAPRPVSPAHPTPKPRRR